MLAMRLQVRARKLLLKMKVLITYPSEIPRTEIYLDLDLDAIQRRLKGAAHYGRKIVKAS